MATRRKKKRSTGKKPEPHCKRVTRSDGSKRTMCWGANGKITSKAKVDAYHKRKRGGRKAA